MLPFLPAAAFPMTGIAVDMSLQVTLEIALLLFVIAMIAGWVDAVAGGGGLITVPALILVGLPPAAAIATNKLQGSTGTLAAAAYCVRQGAVSIKENAVPLVYTAVGSIMGGLIVAQVDASFLNAFVPLLLISIGFYFLFFAKGLDESSKPKVAQSRMNTAVVPSIGFYDGFFGPGAGTFYATGFVSLRGFTIRSATAHAKLFNFVSNISALLYFIFFGQIVWLIGGVMIGGQILGAYLGARIALKAGAKVIRPVTIIVCFAMSIRLLWNLIA